MRELVKKLTPKPIIYLYQKLRYLWIVAFFYLFRIFPMNKRKIVLCNVWGFGDNAKYVTEELVRRKLPYELIFITNHPVKSEQIHGVQFVRANSLAAIKALATAGVWVESNRKEAFTRKRKGQYYIQLWHGGLPLKKIEGDCAEFLGEAYIKRAKRDSKITDLYVSNGTFCTDMYRRAFWFSGQILECGTPRNDILLSKEQSLKDKTKKALGIDKITKIALYAPTYRGLEENYSYSLDFVQLHKTLEKRFLGEWVIIVRLHPLVANHSHEFKYNDFIVNGNDYPDMYELMQASDVLITDYSNTMFEFSMMNRPVFLYTRDVKNYTSQRGLYFTIDELPFSSAVNEYILFKNIETFVEEEYVEKVNQFFHKIELIETGKASKIVVQKIQEVVET